MWNQDAPSDDDMFADEAIEVNDRDEEEEERNSGTADDTAKFNKLAGDLDSKKAKVANPNGPKREMKPRVKYTEYDLIGEKGLKVLKQSFEGYKPPTGGKAPFADMTDILEKMELWAHRVFPSMQFDDFLQRTEQLGKKRPVKAYMAKLRLGMDVENDDEEIFKQPEKKEKKRDQIVIIE